MKLLCSFSKSFKNVCCIILLVLLFFNSPVNSQGIYQNWGMTPSGGANNLGVIFSTDSTGGSLKARYSFEYINRGSVPGYGHLTLFNGKLYGLTSLGSGGNILKSSVLFEFDPSTNTYTKKKDLNPDDGINNQGSLVEYNNELYGMSSFGGSNNAGVIFKYDPATNNYTKLFDLVANTGSNPNGDLIVFNNKMYGLTTTGGANGVGVIFEYDPISNVYASKFNFDANNGTFPHGSLTLYNNKFYGLAAGGGSSNAGVLFEYDPASNTFVKKIDFARETGMSPVGSLLVFNNLLWGLTSFGAGNDVGGLFQYDPLNNTYTNKIDMTDADGNAPVGNLINVNGKLLGLASHGGSTNGGVLFDYDPVTNAYTKRVDLNPFNGQYPLGTLTYFNNKTYGYTSQGGANDRGVIFEYDPNTFVYAKKIDFNSTNGLNPYSSLTYFNNNLYGVTSSGGTDGNYGGILFKYDLSNQKETTEINFDTIKGKGPLTTLIAQNNLLFGATVSGGANKAGVLFSYDPVSKTYTKLFEFDTLNGYNMQANLLLYNNKLFGTAAGGIHKGGVLFEYNLANATYTKKYDFDSITGRNPQDLLIWNDKLYGVAQTGGINNQGVLFEYDLINNTYSPKFNFAGTYSGVQYLSLFNNKMYGVSSELGTNTGVLFEYDPASNIYTKKIDFNSTTGIYPHSPLILRNNLFYSMTTKGGNLDLGTIFEYNPLTNAFTKKSDFDSINGSIPQINGLISIPATVANGVTGICTGLFPFNINNSNNNNWQATTDNEGNAIAELNANGNNLGTVNSSLYVQDNPGRTAAGNLHFLNRNVTITVQNQPAAGQPVSVRLYIKKTELDDLINTPGSGISSVNDLAVYKSENSCDNNIGTSLIKLNTTAESWGPNYVLSVQVNSFSTFYFTNTNAALPIVLMDFAARKISMKTIQLSWQTSSEINSQYFEIERSLDGSHFDIIGKVPASGNSSITKGYSYPDVSFPDGILYYRLKMMDKDGRFVYSKVIVIHGNKDGLLPISPNPARDIIYIEGSNRFNQLEFIDASGKLVLKSLPINSNRYNISRLPEGIYMVRMVNNKEVVFARLIKL